MSQQPMDAAIADFVAEHLRDQHADALSERLDRWGVSDLRSASASELRDAAYRRG